MTINGTSSKPFIRKKGEAERMVGGITPLKVLTPSDEEREEQRRRLRETILPDVSGS